MAEKFDWNAEERRDDPGSQKLVYFIEIKKHFITKWAKWPQKLN